VSSDMGGMRQLNTRHDTVNMLSINTIEAFIQWYAFNSEI